MIKVERENVTIKGNLWTVMVEAAMAVNAVAEGIVEVVGTVPESFRETVNVAIDDAESKNIESRGAAIGDLKELHEVLSKMEEILNEKASRGSAHEGSKKQG